MSQLIEEFFMWYGIQLVGGMWRGGLRDASGSRLRLPHDGAAGDACSDWNREAWVALCSKSMCTNRPLLSCERLGEQMVSSVQASLGDKKTCPLVQIYSKETLSLFLYIYERICMYVCVHTYPVDPEIAR